MPKPEQLINHVPLRHLPGFTPFMCPTYKKRLIAALTKRHMNQQKNALYRRVHNLTPMYLALAGRQIVNARMLDARRLDNYKEKIKAGYIKLLK